VFVAVDLDINDVKGVVVGCEPEFECVEISLSSLELNWEDE